MKLLSQILLIAVFVLCNLYASAQMVINEVSSINASVIQDEDGDSPDWIELYNDGGSVVNLEGYGLSDKPSDPFKWTFPIVTIDPGDHLIVFASGKDRKSFTDHWETAIYSDVVWRYIVPTTEPDTLWRHTGFDDSSWGLGQGGIGYGDGDDNTILTPPIGSVYMRKEFTVVDTGDIEGAMLHMDYDDAFVAYLNGVEIARRNVGQNGFLTAFSELAFENHEAVMYSGNDPDRFPLDDKKLKSILTNGTNVLAIQVHNVNPFSSDLTAMAFLSFGIVTGSANYGPVPVWFDASTAGLHTNFKLSQNGEKVVLTHKSGSRIDSTVAMYLQADNSHGRQFDGDNFWVIFAAPSPGAPNGSPPGLSGYTSDPVFSSDAGFYLSAETLSITTPDVGAVIRYTIDGSIPTDQSTLYTNSLIIERTRPIRARAFHSTKLPSNVVTNTYFFNDPTSTSLPIISITINPDELWDYNTGIYVKGPDAGPSIPFFGANFWQDWERVSHMEYFEKNRDEAFELDVGLKIFGNWSRSNPQKSFKIIARENYGTSRIKHKIFEDRDVSEFKQIVLRNSGNDFNRTHIKDALIQTIALRHTDADAQAYQPAAVYLNGEYWGVYNIREKINEHYIANNHDVDADSIDLLQYVGLVMTGTNEDYVSLFNFIYNNDMSLASNYSQVESWIDLDNYIDYFALEMYINNWDWMSNNIRYWRPQRDGASWRHILWDLDLGMGGAWGYTVSSLDSNTNKTWEANAVMFTRLLNNTTFRNRFINRKADLINTVFASYFFDKLVNTFRDSIDAEMPRHFTRWGQGFNNPNWGNPGSGSYDQWRNFQLSQLKNFNKFRQLTARDQIEEYFNLKKQEAITLNVFPEGAGEIKINTVTIDTFPWAGIYFDSVPITITAIPNPGYEFSFWQSQILYTSQTQDISLTFNPDTGDIFTAYFFGAPDTPKITISEINYKSDGDFETGDWIELWNYGTVDFDLSEWTIKDSDDGNKFKFPEGLEIKAGEFLVVCSDLVKFKAVHTGIDNITGSFNFGLNSFADAVRLYDDEMNLHLIVDFTGKSPWPDVTADNLGRTLELLDQESDIDDYSNWFVGCPGGSPGKAFISCPFTSMEEPTASSMTDDFVRVYPNPVTDYFEVEVDPAILGNSTFSFALYDITGRSALQFYNINKDELRISRNLPSGMYVYRILLETGEMSTGKLVFR